MLLGVKYLWHANIADNTCMIASYLNPGPTARYENPISDIPCTLIYRGLGEGDWWGGALAP